MSMRFVGWAFTWGLILAGGAGAEQASLILLGDMHHDQLADHDPDWLKSKPDDYRQVTQEYTVYTRENWDDFVDVLLKQVSSIRPGVKAIVQTGDLQEGLAGRPDLARQMARHALEALRAEQFAAPWILVKGNHDVTGPGAREAYDEVVLPFLRTELKQDIATGYYSWRSGDIEIICADYYAPNGEGLLPFVRRELEASTARYKFVAVHEPIIPVTARCWHVLRQPQDRPRREELLSLLARHRAVVLCGHLHKYSVVRRETEAGPVVQIMMNSVIREKGAAVPAWYTTEYGPALINREPQFDPATREKRAAILAEEARHVTDFRLADLPGYGVLKLDTDSGSMRLQVFRGTSTELLEEVDVGRLVQAGGPATKPAVP